MTDFYHKFVDLKVLSHRLAQKKRQTCNREVPTGVTEPMAKSPPQLTQIAQFPPDQSCYGPFPKPQWFLRTNHPNVTHHDVIVHLETRTRPSLILQDCPLSHCPWVLYNLGFSAAQTDLSLDQPALDRSLFPPAAKSPNCAHFSTLHSMRSCC